MNTRYISWCIVLVGQAISCASSFEFHLFYSGRKLLVPLFVGERDRTAAWFSLDFGESTSKLFYRNSRDLFNDWGTDESGVAGSSTISLGRDRHGSEIDDVSVEFVADANRRASVLEVGVKGVLAAGRGSELWERYPHFELSQGDLLLKFRGFRSQEQLDFDNFMGGFSVETFAVGGTSFGMRLKLFSIGGRLRKRNGVLIFDPSVEVMIVPSEFFGTSQEKAMTTLCDESGTLSDFMFPILFEFEQPHQRVSLPRELMQYPSSAVKRRSDGQCLIRMLTWDREEIVVGRQFLAAVDRLIIDRTSIRVVPHREAEKSVTVLPVKRVPEQDWIVASLNLVSHSHRETDLILREVAVDANSFVVNRLGPSLVLVEADPRQIIKRRIAQSHAVIQLHDGGEKKFYTDGMFRRCESTLGLILFDQPNIQLARKQLTIGALHDGFQLLEITPVQPHLLQDARFPYLVNLPPVEKMPGSFCKLCIKAFSSDTTVQRFPCCGSRIHTSCMARPVHKDTFKDMRNCPFCGEHFKTRKSLFLQDPEVLQAADALLGLAETHSPMKRQRRNSAPFFD